MRFNRVDAFLLEAYAEKMSINQLKGTIEMMKEILRRREIK